MHRFIHNGENGCVPPFLVLYFFRAPRKSLNTTAVIILVEKMAEKEEEEEKENTQLAGVNASAKTYEGIEKIFNQAEHARHREHAEAFLDKLVQKEIVPLEGDGFLQYDEGYDDFELLLEWWDYDPDGTYSWQGTLQYFIHYYKDGKYLTDDELKREVKKIRKDILRKEKEREEYGKELEKLLEGEEATSDD